MADNVKVAVRVRPFNQREKDRKAKMCIEMPHTTQQTIIKDPVSGKVRNYTFDFSYNSFVDREDPEYASQGHVWKDIGVGVLENAYNGYNCSLFAYGQTGAGKSYSMMGYGPDKGIIPLACERIFDRIDSNTDDTLTIKVEASMLEIYMEKIRDLFNPKAGDLKIRNDPKKGFYVDNLTRNAVGSYASIDKLMEAGTKARTVASTNMNATSSRAHTIFQVILTQTKVDAAVGKATDKVAIINLIDLAGSERQSGTGATGARLKEGSAINLSLSSLGNCISALAHNSGGGKKVRVPYRDSVLTMLLQNSLGGNAKTIMIAAISPADINHDETLSTLRYADRAKQIKNKAVVNEDPNQKLIRGLRQEIEELRKALEGGMGATMAGAGLPVDAALSEDDREAMRQKVINEERERIRQELEAKLREEMEESKTWEERLRETDARAAEREAELRQLGVVTGAERTAQLEKSKLTPHMLNLHEDPALSGQIMHFFDDGELRIGRDDAPVEQNVHLAGLNMQAEHAIVTNVDGVVSLSPAAEGVRIMRNGDPVTETVQLHHMDRVLFGNNHFFKIVIPAEAATWEPAPDMPAQIDHMFAVLEQNKAQVMQVAQEEAKRRAEAEASRAAAEAQIKEYERQMEEERAKQQAEAEEKQKYYEMKEKELAEKQAQGLQQELEEQQARLHKERADMEEQFKKHQEELEAKLAAQIEETNKMTRQKEREARERSLLDEKLLKTIPLVNEANAICEELDEGLTFTVKLMANPNRPITWESKAADDGEEHTVLDTEVFVMVASGEAGVQSRFWIYDKFMDRLYMMREMYQLYVENDRSLVGSPYLEDDNNPFVDPPGDVRVGAAKLYLDPVLYLVPVDDWIPILDYKGVRDGELHVRLVPHFTAEPPTSTGADLEAELLDHADEDVEELAHLKGKPLYITVFIPAARGLPPDKSAFSYTKFHFFRDGLMETPAFDGKSINPKYNFQHTFQVVVTDDFIGYVSGEAVDFEVYARLAEPIRSTSALAATSARPSPAKDTKVASPTAAELADLREQVALEERQRLETEVKESEAKIQRELQEAREAAQQAEERAKKLHAEMEEAKKRMASSDPSKPASPAGSSTAGADGPSPEELAKLAAENEAMKKQLEDLQKQKSKACIIL